MPVNEAKYCCITQHLYDESIRKFIMFVCTWTTVPNHSMCCNSIFAAVLHTWITALFSTLEWGSLRLTPTNKSRTFQYIAPSSKVLPLLDVNIVIKYWVAVVVTLEVTVLNFHTNIINDKTVNQVNMVHLISIKVSALYNETPFGTITKCVEFYSTYI